MSPDGSEGHFSHEEWGTQFLYLKMPTDLRLEGVQVWLFGPARPDM